MQPIRQILSKLHTDIRAVTALEYAMIASLIAVAAVTVITGLGTQLSSTFNYISSVI
jgi:pilus assembly protein Flp/PilA